MKIKPDWSKGIIFNREFGPIEVKAGWQAESVIGASAETNIGISCDISAAVMLNVEKSDLYEKIKGSYTIQVLGKDLLEQNVEESIVNEKKEIIEEKEEIKDEVIVHVENYIRENIKIKLDADEEINNINSQIKSSVNKQEFYESLKLKISDSVSEIKELKSKINELEKNFQNYISEIDSKNGQIVKLISEIESSINKLNKYHEYILKQKKKADILNKKSEKITEYLKMIRFEGIINIDG